MRAFLKLLSRFFQRFLRGGSQPARERYAAGSADAIADSQSTSRSAQDAERQAVSSELRQLVYRATCAMPRKRMHAGQFGSLLREIDDSFSYQKYNFTKLIYLLEAVPDLVNLEKVSKPGAAPAYYVRSVLDIKQLLTKAIASYKTEGEWVHVESVMEAIASRNPTFSIQTYGYSQFKTFLQSCSPFIEFNPDSADYIRLQNNNRSNNRSSNPAKSKDRPTKSDKPKPAASKSLRPVPKSARTEANTADKIVHLSKFAQFTPDTLTQKVTELAAITLPERWYFGPQPPENFAYPILKSYLRYTFIRLQHERKVIISSNNQYKAFNTGLLDKLLRPIYGLLSPHPTKSHSWDLTFCIPGEGTGKLLVANFPDLPAPANYLSNPAKAFYHLPAGPPEVDWPHIIKDNMERLPSEFIARYAPAGFTPLDTRTLVGQDFHNYKRSFAEALDVDSSAYRNIVNRLKEALSRTLMKTQINYKTAVPTYYPNINSIDLLLPICLLEEGVADCAIVARQTSSGKYIGHTILTMRQAYNNARLICKLDEHWLSRAMTLSQTEFEAEEEDDSEEFESDDVRSEEEESLRLNLERA